MKNSKEGIAVDVWRLVPRPDEGPGLSYLATRHKNTVTLSSKAAETQTTGPTVTRATVRRIDAAGNPYEQTVTLQEGQVVDGEIISTDSRSCAFGARKCSGSSACPAVKRRPPRPSGRLKVLARTLEGQPPLPASTRPTTDGALVEGGCPCAWSKHGYRNCKQFAALSDTQAGWITD